jgi:uridine phosphorylase
MPEERPVTAPGSLEPALLTARGMLAWRRPGGLPSVPGCIILTHQTSLFRWLAPRLRTRALTGLSAEVRTVPDSAGRLSVAGKLGVGGPATAVLVEELAVLGAEQIVAVDIAASIEASRRSGSFVIASAAMCGDGTSRHYAGDEKRVPAEEGLMSRLTQALSADGAGFETASVWSTDAPYRETATLLDEARRANAGLIDMETAALYASCAALGIAAVALLVVADEIFDEWRPPPDMRLIQAQLRRAAGTAKQCLLP